MNVNNLTLEQKQLIFAWVEEGLDLNAIQKRLNDECDLRLTFMDTRFLILDLGLEIKSPEKKPTPAATDTAAMAATTSPAAATLANTELEDTLPNGNLELSLDDVIPEGMAVTGKVKFPSGAHGSWFMDNQYRIGIDPAPASPEPTEKDMTIFEREIERFLRSQMGAL